MQTWTLIKVQLLFKFILILKCAIPVFEGLFARQKHNTIVGKLLFEFATWHSLAKLRLHTETTIVDLENSTTRLGRLLRKFESKICPHFDTKELPGEETARKRREAKASKKRATIPKSTSSLKKKKTRRTLNLSTYKLHSLGAYVRSIRKYGTTDGTSSQTVFFMS
jgi:hypothetical protein